MTAITVDQLRQLTKWDSVYFRLSGGGWRQEHISRDHPAFRIVKQRLARETRATTQFLVDGDPCASIEDVCQRLNEKAAAA